jgi:hypothetical protein
LPAAARSVPRGGAPCKREILGPLRMMCRCYFSGPAPRRGHAVPASMCSRCSRGRRRAVGAAPGQQVQLGPDGTHTPAHRQIFFRRRARLRDLVFLFARAPNDVQESPAVLCSTIRGPRRGAPACKRLHSAAARQQNQGSGTRWGIGARDGCEPSNWGSSDGSVTRGQVRGTRQRRGGMAATRSETRGATAASAATSST